MNKKRIATIFTALIFGFAAYSVVSCLNTKVEDQNHVSYKKSFVKYHTGSDNNDIVQAECYSRDNICYVSVSRMSTYLGQLIGIDMTSTTANNAISISYNKGDRQEKITIDTTNAEVSVSSPNFYSYVTTDVLSTEGSEYKEYQYSYLENKLTYNLKDYGLDAYWIDDKVVLPLSIFDLIFCNSISYHYYYINDEIYGDINETNYSGISQNSPTQAERDLTYNYFRLMLSQYYGLSKYKGFDDDTNVIEFLSPYKDDLLSLNSQTFEQAEYNIINVALDDPHTNVFENEDSNFYSIYHNTNSEIEINYGFRYRSIAAKLEAYEKNRSRAANSITITSIKTNDTNIRIYNQTAFILLDQFVYSSEKTISNINNDTFTLMKYSLQAIQEYSVKHNNSIKNVVVDLTCNTGGYVISGMELLSFMTNKPITWSYDYNNTQSYGYTEFYIDNNLNYDCRDTDAYTSFNWFIQTSPCSFSCANLVPFIAKDYGIAKIIGQTSGGGACVVGSLILPDGLRINTSCPSNRNVSRDEMDGKNSRNCEDGVVPDITISDLNIYNYSYIDKIINS